MEDLGDLSGLMKKAQEMQRKMQQLQAELKDRIAEGSAGGGMVVAKVNGRQELIGLTIDPEVVNREEVDLLEDLVKAAVGQAMKKIQEMMQQEVSGFPGIQGLFS